jgi:hypothetical protein
MASLVNCLEAGSAVPVVDAHPQTSQLEAIAEQVLRDSRVESQDYLKESLVPHGGE